MHEYKSLVKWSHLFCAKSGNIINVSALRTHHLRTITESLVISCLIIFCYFALIDERCTTIRKRAQNRPYHQEKWSLTSVELYCTKIKLGVGALLRSYRHLRLLTALMHTRAGKKRIKMNTNKHKSNKQSIFTLLQIPCQSLDAK